MLLGISGHHCAPHACMHAVYDYVCALTQLGMHQCVVEFNTAQRKHVSEMHVCRIEA